MPERVMYGIVKWWSNQRGYGYITVATKNGFVDYFAHYKNITSDHKFKKLNIGWVVAFKPGENDKGKLAMDIRLVGYSIDDLQVVNDTTYEELKKVNSLIERGINI